MNYRSQYIEALRSGEYTQARARLKTEDGCFCAMGLACELYRKAHPDYHWAKYDLNGTAWTSVFVAADDTQFEYDAPHEVLSYFGLTNAEAKSIIDLNDQMHASFEQIAKFLDVNDGRL